MRDTLKLSSGVVASVVGIWAPAVPLMVVALLFIAVDFVTGVLADRQRALHNNRKWHFESRKAWQSVRKLSMVMMGIVMASTIDTLLTGVVNLSLAKVFTGFVCGVEFWSYLENSSQLSDRKLFRGLRQVVGNRIEQVVGSRPEREMSCGEERIVGSRPEREVSCGSERIEGGRQEQEVNLTDENIVKQIDSNRDGKAEQRIAK